ncbi:MAG TPA: cellulase family glycosylhydrolase [Gemmataceae bacterium]
MAHLPLIALLVISFTPPVGSDDKPDARRTGLFEAGHAAMPLADGPKRYFQALGVSSDAANASAEMPWIAVSADKRGFVLAPDDKPFTPWGFNYDRDAKGRLIEDYWHDEWPKVEADFAQMKKLGANVVRIHLQFGKFMDGQDKPNEKELAHLEKLLRLAEQQRLYLDLTGLGCYRKKDVPAWYNKLLEKDRWDAQARFWQAVAGKCKDSPAVFCYDLMNEPVVPGGQRNAGDWFGPAFAGKHFVQFIALDQRGRPRPDIARQWVKHLTTAIRAKDKRHLITVGLVDWSLDRPGLTSGFIPGKIAADLDFVAVHLYPKSGKRDEALKTLEGFAVGKPVIVEETFPLSCSLKELEAFIDGSKKHASGWIGFYWGQPPEELRGVMTIPAAITLGWLELFERKAKAIAK